MGHGKHVTCSSYKLPPIPGLGLILSWSGAIVDIPKGFALCDGDNGTPDLRNLFVAGSGDTYAVHKTGGSKNHTHPFTGEGHFHPLDADSDIHFGADYNFRTSTNPVGGTTNNQSDRLPYYALAFIMKVGF